MAAAALTVGIVLRKHSTSRWSWFAAATRKIKSERCGVAICFAFGEKWRRFLKSYGKRRVELVEVSLRLGIVNRKLIAVSRAMNA